MRTLFVVFGLAAAFFWSAFLIALLRCVGLLVLLGEWRGRSLNSFLDSSRSDAYADIWIGWYLLVGTLVTMLASTTFAFLNNRRT